MICARCGECKCKKATGLITEYEEYYQPVYNTQPPKEHHYCRECYLELVRTGGWPMPAIVVPFMKNFGIPAERGYLRRGLVWIREKLRPCGVAIRRFFWRLI